MLLSRKVRKSAYIDSMISSFELNKPDGIGIESYQKAFNRVFVLLRGKSLDIKANEFDIFMDIGKQIGNDELFSAPHVNGLLPEINQTNIFKNLIDACQFDPCAEYFKSVLNIPQQIIEKVLSHPQPNLQNEEKLYEK